MSNPDRTDPDEDPTAAGSDITASDPDALPAAADGPDPHRGDDRFGEVREAAGAVVESLKWLLEATERVIEDPDAFAAATAKGRSVVAAFTEGFRAQGAPEPHGDDHEEPGGDRWTRSDRSREDSP